MPEGQPERRPRGAGKGRISKPRGAASKPVPANAGRTGRTNRPAAAGPARPRSTRPQTRTSSTPRQAARPAPRQPARQAPRDASRQAPRRPAADLRGQQAPRWFDLILSLVQAPVGAAQSQADRLVAELVRGGQIGQREAERLLREARLAQERAAGRAQHEADRIDRFIESRIEDILNRVNIPSRSDIERLNNSVDILTRKVEALLDRERGAR